MDNIIDRRKLEVRLVLTTFVIYFFSTFASKFHWYTSIPWLDMLMHAIGGLWVGFILFYIFPIKGKKFTYFIKVFLGILLVGVGWEVFEFVVNNLYLAKEPFDIVDTSSDIFFDMLGGACSIFYFSKRIMLKDKITV